MLAHPNGMITILMIEAKLGVFCHNLIDQDGLVGVFGVLNRRLFVDVPVETRIGCDGHVAPLVTRGNLPQLLARETRWKTHRLLAAERTTDVPTSTCGSEDPHMPGRMNY